MIAAMHKRTKIGCESLIQDAINHCPVPSIQNYIKRNYTKNTEKWGLWARQHSPLLLQVTSTNSLESFHSELKKITSSLHGLIQYVIIFFSYFTRILIQNFFIFRCRSQHYQYQLQKKDLKLKVYPLIFVLRKYLCMMLKIIFSKKSKSSPFYFNN